MNISSNGGDWYSQLGGESIGQTTLSEAIVGDVVDLDAKTIGVAMVDATNEIVDRKTSAMII